MSALESRPTEPAMRLDLPPFSFDLTLHAAAHGDWFEVPLLPADDGVTFDRLGLSGRLDLRRTDGRIDYTLAFRSNFNTRLRLQLELIGQTDSFHLIPGNIHGDNNAPHVRPNEFPVLATDRLSERNRSPLWELRADRASHPVSLLCCPAGAIGVSIDPYSDCPGADDGFIRNGLFAALPNRFGVSLGYGNDPLTFHNKTVFTPATCHLSRGASAGGSIRVAPGGRRGAHTVVREIYAQLHDRPTFTRSHADALRGLAEAFIHVNYDPTLDQYTNRKCSAPVDRTLRPWRAIVEIGWTGGTVLAYPFLLTERLLPGVRFPKSPETILDQICSGYNDVTGLLRDTALNRFTKHIPDGWNTSDINGWWSGGRVPLTRDNHCAYTNAHAAYYLLAAARHAPAGAPRDRWAATALRVLDTAIDLQRPDGAFGYIFNGTKKEVLDYDGFAGCWFAAALPLAWKLSGTSRYRAAAERAIRFYHGFVAGLSAWGTPMDTCKSIDSEGNLAFIRAARLMHEATGEAIYLDLLRDGAHYEYLWRYAFRARPEAPPLKGSNWNSCGGSLTSVSNPHIHPMSVVVSRDLEYLARATGDDYHQHRADDGMAWLMNTLELYPAVTGYGRYGVLSERTCPSDGLLEERFADTGLPSSTWWSYNAWAAANAMEALAEAMIDGPSSRAPRRDEWR
jgi:hypothetical protein